MTHSKGSAGVPQFGSPALWKVTFQKINEEQQNKKEVTVCLRLLLVCLPSCFPTGMYLLWCMIVISKEHIVWNSTSDWFPLAQGEGQREEYWFVFLLSLSLHRSFSCCKWKYWFKLSAVCPQLSSSSEDRTGMETCSSFTWQHGGMCSMAPKCCLLRDVCNTFVIWF